MESLTLVRYLQHKAGKQHRGTVRYAGGSTDVLYLRPDVREQRMLSQIDRMLKRLRPEASPEEGRSFPFGAMKATVRLFEEAIILHFPTGNDRGIVVSLEPETARDLNAFVAECSRLISR